MTRRRPSFRWMTVVFGIALAVRFAFIAIGPGWTFDQPPGGDPAEYHQIATSLASGTGYAKPWNGGGPDAGRLVPTAVRPPLWPAALAVLYKFTGPSPFAGRLLGAVFDALTCALLVPLGALVLSVPAGRLAGLLAALYPPLWINVGSLMSEALFTLTVVVTLLLAVRTRDRPTVGRATVLGLAAGAATLGRPNGFVLAGALVVWAFLALRPLGARHAALIAATCLNAALLVVSPWVLWSGLRLGEVVPVTTNGGSVIGGDYASSMLDRRRPDWGGWDVLLVVKVLQASSTELEFDHRLRRLGTDWISHHPRGALELVGLHAVRYFDLYWGMEDRRVTYTPTPWTRLNEVTVVASWLASGAAVVGLVRLKRARRLGAVSPALVAWAAFAVSGILLAAATRYRAPAEPVVVLLVAAALTARRPDENAWAPRSP